MSDLSPYFGTLSGNNSTRDSLCRQISILKQTEVVNRLVVQMLLMYNHKHRRTWDESLPYIQHSYNRAQHNSMGKSPFKICYGFQPSAPIDLISSLT